MFFFFYFKVVGFSDDNYDRRQPHRQNRLCGAKSSSEVIFASRDFANAEPDPNQDTKPTFELLKNLMLPLVYVAIDSSTPSSVNNGQTVRSFKNWNLLLSVTEKCCLIRSKYLTLLFRADKI